MCIRDRLNTDYQIYSLPCKTFQRNIFLKPLITWQQLFSTVEENEILLTDEKRNTYQLILQSVYCKSGNAFFLDAPGGTSKTFLIKLTLSKLRSEGKIVLAAASSGIATTLLPSGKTAHSLFKIPIDLNCSEFPVCNICLLYTSTYLILS